MFIRALKGFIKKHPEKIVTGIGVVGVTYVASKSDKFSFKLYDVIEFSKEKKPEGIVTKVKNVAVKRDIIVDSISKHGHIGADIENVESKEGGLTVKNMREGLSETQSSPTSHTTSVVSSTIGGSVLINPSISHGALLSEKEAADKIFIFMKDRRVLNSGECCDTCIKRSVQSIHEIRKFLCDKQIEFSHLKGTAIFKLIDSLREITRSFLTFEEKLKNLTFEKNLEDSYKKAYFDELKNFRTSVQPILNEIQKIANNTKIHTSSSSSSPSSSNDFEAASTISQPSKNGMYSKKDSLSSPGTVLSTHEVSNSEVGFTESPI